MRTWINGLLAWTNSIECEHDLFTGVQGYTREMEFEWFSFGVRTCLPFSNPVMQMRCNFPPTWQRRYHDASYLQIDPSVRRACANPSPFVWDDDMFDQAPEFWEEAKSEGLRIGWACSLTHPSRQQSMVTLARGHNRLLASELDANELKMRWLHESIAPCIERLLVPRVYQACQYHLTARETEVLRWTADGKTLDEIAQILAISVDTVKFHVKNAMNKLGTTNKTAAVVRAAAMGMIS
ncbi:autoinducer binding domain-containing protein [Pseudomonas sp. S1(2024)]|uniref:autoinducer binding domain-containing protein n=1 Tax=Pseudomonas sp. S1(2024) TaxID=3390191 RepID=UPI00397E6D89